MNSQYTYCQVCDKIYNSRKELTDHNSYMRRKGNIQGHELRATQSLAAFSSAGSHLGTKDVKMEDFNDSSYIHSIRL